MKQLSLFLVLALLWGCDNDEIPDDPSTFNPPNILLVIADDMGKDATNGFSEGAIKPATPNLDKLKNEGLIFNNLWVYPTCSPTRAAIITGKYGYRTNVKMANDELAASEVILQKYINENTNNAYATAIVGKWHLAGDNGTNDPETLGLDYYAGLIRGATQNYYQWQLTENGVGSQQTEYITKEFTDRAIDWVSDQSKPWFLWMAYNAPHTPFHVPPAEMHQQGDLPAYTEDLDPIPYYMAAIEAMDFQLGELLASIPEEELDNTVIIFMGDNGSPNQVAQAPFASNRAKGTLYKGGINVPMFVSGAGVTRNGQAENLICSTDLFSTIAELAGVNSTEIHDSKSFKTLLSTATVHRNFQYSEMNNGTADLWAISNGAFKLIVNENGNEELFDLATDPHENTNLLDGTLTAFEESAKEVLEAELLLIRN